MIILFGNFFLVFFSKFFIVIVSFILNIIKKIFFFKLKNKLSNYYQKKWGKMKQEG